MFFSVNLLVDEFNTFKTISIKLAKIVQRTPMLLDIISIP